MKFSDFCKPFHKKGGKKISILLGIDSQNKIAEFFLSSAVKRSEDPVLAYEDDTFRKWFTGDRKVTSEVWARVAKSLTADINGFAADIEAVLNNQFLPKIASDFEISFPKGEVPEKGALAVVLAQQFLEIARGDGEAYNVMNELYHDAFSYNDYSVYINKSWNKYSKMKTLLYTASEHDFYEFFVCNNIRTSPLNFHNMHENELFKAIERGEISKGSREFELLLQMREGNPGTIKAVTMEKLAKICKYSLLVGMGGIGKSMMMRHLFLSANQDYPKLGLLPILVILREFNPDNTNLINMIADSVQRFDATFSIQQLKILLANGKCRLLLDGLDEIKSTDTNIFLKQLEALIDQYPDNQIVMSTRRFSSFIELSRFRVLEMMTFTHKQSLELIDKLEYCPEEPKLKAQFREKLITDYFKSHEEFVNNPLLLTLMLMSYHRFAGIPEKRHLFYSQAYDTLLMRHDSGKLYNRVFHSVNDPSDFTKVFREFCARSYRKHDYEFDRKKFESYFKVLKSIQWLDDKKMTLDNFIYDACHSACLMYEEGQTYHFLHRSFQEYFFADYYSHKDQETLQKLSRYLLQVKYDPYDDAGAFLMMYDLDPENIEKFVLYPYLHQIFGSDTEQEHTQFWKYLSYGYRDCQFTIINYDLAEQYNVDTEQIKHFAYGGGFSAGSVIQIKLLRMLSKRYDYPSELSNLSPEDIHRPSLIIFLGHKTTGKNGSKTDFFFIPVSEQELENEAFSRVKRNSAILNESGKPVIFGYYCGIFFNELLKSPEKYSKVIAIFEDENSTAKAEFREMKSLYIRLKDKYDRNDYTDDDDF